MDKKENKLQKGSGFHLDILVLGFSALINGVLGKVFTQCTGGELGMKMLFLYDSHGQL